MRRRHRILFLLLTLIVLVLFAIDMAVGSVNLSLAELYAVFTGDAAVPESMSRIVIDIRLMRALTAIFAGAALSVSGLQMQTMFRNPLAGPYVLGVSSGASLGVALLMLGAGVVGTIPPMGTALAAWIGAAVILLIVSAIGARVNDIMVVLIIGMMLGSGISAFVQILQYLSDVESLKGFVLWTMGSLADVTPSRMPIFAASVVVGLTVGVASIKPLNLMQLGPVTAATLGLELRWSRIIVFVSTALLAGTVTAFCGPIGFVGLAVPHIARMIFRTADCRVLFPASALAGAIMMLMADIVAKIFVLPVNSLTALMGIPVVIAVVMRHR